MMESAREKLFATRRARILLGVLVALGALWVVSCLQIRALKIELTEVAEEKIQEFLGAEAGETVEMAVPVVTVSKKFLLFGKTTGKVSLYMRPVGGTDTEEGGVEAANSSGHGHQHGALSGINFFLEKNAGNWADRESGRCSSEECQIEGKEAFAKGIYVALPMATE